MGISDLIPKKELTEKEQLKKEFDLKIKLMYMKCLKNPFGIMERENEIRNLFNEYHEKGLFTDKQLKENIESLDKKITEAFKFIETFKVKGFKERLKAYKQKIKEVKND